MAIEDINKPFSCWNCKHYQARHVGPISQNNGECRALPPAACCPPRGEGARLDPVFPIVTTADKTWCSAWEEQKNTMQQQGGR